MPTQPKFLYLHALRCQHDDTVLFHDISFSLASGELCALLGPSGCGKTTLLRAIAGLQTLHAGSIHLDGENITQTRPEKRGIGMVFQDYALFPHMTVAENIGFGVKNKKQRNTRINEMLDLVGLATYGKRYIHELSGGQQQRVALARALAPNPALLLLDEPFSNLDTELRQSLCLRVKDILKAAQVTALLVTHDQTEAFTFADHIGLLLEGKLQQFSAPHDIYYRPATLGVAKFIGQSQFIPATVNENGELQCPFGNLGENSHPPGDYWLLSRPENWLLHPFEGSYPARVTHKTFFGHETRYQITPDACDLQITVALSDDRFAINDTLALLPNFTAMRLFHRDAAVS